MSAVIIETFRHVSFFRCTRRPEHQVRKPHLTFRCVKAQITVTVDVFELAQVDLQIVQGSHLLLTFFFLSGGDLCPR